MSNLLAVPFKKTYQVDVVHAARTYLSENGVTHPDAVKADITQWQELRQKIVGLEANSKRINDILRYAKSSFYSLILSWMSRSDSYHDQLTSILSKFPVDVSFCHSLTNDLQSLILLDSTGDIICIRVLSSFRRSSDTQ